MNRAGTLFLAFAVCGLSGASAWVAHGLSTAPTRAVGLVASTGLDAEPVEDVGDRIVSTSLAADELLLALVPLGRIAGLSTFADDHRASFVAERAAQVPGRVRGSVESILGAGPSFVVSGSFHRVEVYSQLTRFSIGHWVLPRVETFAGIMDNVTGLGRVVGNPAGARHLRSNMERVIAGVMGRARDRNVLEVPRVLMLQRGGETAGGGTLVDEALGWVGASNLAAELGVNGYGAMAPEQVLATEPDFVLWVDYRADGQGRQWTGARSLADHPWWGRLRAVREGKVCVVPARWITSRSHHAVALLTGVERCLWGQQAGLLE